MKTVVLKVYFPMFQNVASFRADIKTKWNKKTSGSAVHGDCVIVINSYGGLYTLSICPSSGYSSKIFFSCCIRVGWIRPKLRLPFSAARVKEMFVKTQHLLFLAWFALPEFIFISLVGVQIDFSFTFKYPYGFYWLRCVSRTAEHNKTWTNNIVPVSVGCNFTEYVPICTDMAGL